VILHCWLRYLEKVGQRSFAVWGEGVRGGAPAAERFFCSLRSPVSLFCYVINGEQLQKSPNLAANGVAPIPWRARNYISRGRLWTVARGFSPWPPPAVNCNPAKVAVNTIQNTCIHWTEIKRWIRLYRNYATTYNEHSPASSTSAKKMESEEWTIFSKMCIQDGSWSGLSQ